MNKGDKDAYIKHLENENAELRKHIEVLEAEIKEIKRLRGMNSQNSSKHGNRQGKGIRIGAENGPTWGLL